MSHAGGEVIVGNKVVAYFEYNGTSCIAISRLYPTFDEMWNNWRAEGWNDCEGGQPPLKVLLYTNYGPGFYWDGEVCLPCKAIVGGMTHEETRKGHPWRQL